MRTSPPLPLDTAFCCPQPLSLMKSDASYSASSLPSKLHPPFQSPGVLALPSARPRGVLAFPAPAPEYPVVSGPMEGMPVPGVCVGKDGVRGVADGVAWKGKAREQNEQKVSFSSRWIEWGR